MRHKVSYLLAFLTTLAVSFSARAETRSTQIVNEVVIDRPIDEVFDYATTAGNWKEWHPNTLGTEGADDHSATAGEEILEHLKFAGIPMGQLFWDVTEHTVPTQWQLTGGSEDGATGLVLTYTMTRISETSTLFRRTVVYETDDNALLAVLDHKLFAPFMYLTSELAIRQLKEAIELR